MSFQPTPQELHLFDVLQTRYRERFAEAAQRQRHRIRADGAARGTLRSGHTEYQVNVATAEALERYSTDLLWAFIERFGSIYGAITLEMLDWIDARVNEATVLLQNDEETRRAHSRAAQLRAIELGTMRAKLVRAGGAGGDESQAAADAAGEYDAFICHAFEDKDLVATPLARRLSEQHRVWYDDFALTIGDSLRQKIERGLSTSRYGIVILSPRFFAKHWPRTELAALTTRQNASGRKVILPVWVEVTATDVQREALLLADLVAAHWSDGLDAVAREITTVLKAK